MLEAQMHLNRDLPGIVIAAIDAKVSEPLAFGTDLTNQHKLIHSDDNGRVTGT